MDYQWNDAVKETIQQQTLVTDEVLIERVYHECKGDVVATIMKLSNVVGKPSTQPSPPTLFDEMRKILDAKDAMLQSKLAEIRKGT